MPKTSVSFEQGPIRPPSESGSLLIRVSRNCPWNNCLFCPVYKFDKFSRRSEEDVKKDIDSIAEAIGEIRNISKKMGHRGKVNAEVYEHISRIHPHWVSPLNWLYFQQGSVFLQDADNMIYSGDKLLEIISYLKSKIPGISRLTTYARSKSLTKKNDEELLRLKEAGLTRIHVGLESGSGKVLDFMKKGVTPEEHIEAGKKVINAGINLSEYVIPGLGGMDNSYDHAVETASVLNEINPHFIRLRTLAVHPASPLNEIMKKGEFHPLDDEGILKEEKLFLENLTGISSELYSDHILNLLEEIEGLFPDDKSYMIGIIDRYFNLPADERELFRIGRRTGVMRYIEDLNKNHLRRRAEDIYRAVKERGMTVDEMIDEIRTKYL